MRSGLGLEGRLVVALEHGLSILAEGIEVLPQDSAAPNGLRLIDLHLQCHYGSIDEFNESIGRHAENDLFRLLAASNRDDLFHSSHLAQLQHITSVHFVHFRLQHV